MINKLNDLCPEEIKLVYAGANKKQLTWRLFQITFVGGYILYKVISALDRTKEATKVKE